MRNLVHTAIGIIDIDNTVEGYICGEENGITMGRETVIKSCKTCVIIRNSDGSERIITPVVTESCMNPEIKTITPIVVKAVFKENKELDTVTVSNQFESIVLDMENNTMEVRTKEFTPKIKKADCAECNNCGRC